MMDLSTPPAAQRRDRVMPVLSDVFDRIIDAADGGRRAPSLERAMDLVARAHEHRDPVAIDNALQELAHASVGARVSLHEEFPDLGGAS